MNDFIKACALDNIFEAQRFEFILNEKGIPYAIKSYHDSAYNGLFQSQLGWGAVLVRAEDVETVQQLLAEPRASKEGQEEPK